MISNIVVYNKKYLYKGIEYDNKDLVFLLNKLSKKRKITLCSHNILIKKYHYSGNKIDKYIDNKISEDFTNKHNLLFHYETDKENKSIYLYSIRNDNIKRLYDNASELIIEPIQFRVKNFAVKKMKRCCNILIVFKIKDINHLIKVENGLIIDAIISKEFNEIEDYIADIKNKDYEILIDKNIKDTNSIAFDYSLDLGVDTYEKIC